MAWIELHQTLPGHRKTMRLRRILKICTAQAVGHLCMLWLWALDNCQDGDMSDLLDCEIAEAAGYDSKKPEEFVSALRSAGFVDEEGRIHDWDTYAGRLMDRREQTKEQTRKRVERYRARQKQATETECNTLHSVTCNGAETLGNAPTVPNRTVPNSTVPNRTVPNHNDDDDDDGARAREDTSSSITIAEEPDPFDPTPQTPEEAAVRRVLLEFLPCGLPAPNNHIADEIDNMISLPDYGPTPDTRADIIIRAMKAIGEAPKEKHSWGNVKGLIRYWQKNGERSERNEQHRPDYSTHTDADGTERTRGGHRLADPETW